MKILMTGATGFVGAHLARNMVRDGHDVRALVLPGVSLSAVQDVRDRLTIVQGNLTMPDAIDAEAFAVDACIHLAWFAEPGRYWTAPENVDLVFGTLRLAQRLAETGCRRLVAVGTCAEYDTSHGWLSESTPLVPTQLYSACKASTYLMLRQLASSAGMSFAWARLFYLFGPGEHEKRLVSSVCRSLIAGEPVLLTPGQQVRDFLHVEDVALALSAIALSDLVGAVNVGSGIPVTVASVARFLGEQAARPDLVRLGAVPYAANDPPFICADSRRLRAQTDWVPRWDLEGGLRATLDWWRERQLAGQAR
jgi:nucleoside-diphosphate-sugar epimerase